MRLFRFANLIVRESCINVGNKYVLNPSIRYQDATVLYARTFYSNLLDVLFGCYSNIGFHSKIVIIEGNISKTFFSLKTPMAHYSGLQTSPSVSDMLVVTSELITSSISILWSELNGVNNVMALTTLLDGAAKPVAFFFRQIERVGLYFFS